MDFDGVRALVVLPELPVAGGAVGAPASVVPEELDDCCVVDSLVRALVVLPEFAPAVGSFFEFPDAELEVLPASLDVLFDFRLLAVPVLVPPADGVSPVGGVALAEGSAAALFFVLLVAVGVVFEFSPSVFPALSVLVLGLLRDEVVEVPEPLVELAVSAAWFESVFLLDLVSFGVVEPSPELACVEFAASEESAAGFFFFFVVVESLCDWSVDCVDRTKLLPCDALTRPNPSNHAVKTAVNIAKRSFFFITVL
jgi:hypothetical protein